MQSVSYAGVLTKTLVKIF